MIKGGLFLTTPTLNGIRINDLRLGEFVLSKGEEGSPLFGVFHTAEQGAHYAGIS